MNNNIILDEDFRNSPNYFSSITETEYRLEYVSFIENRLIEFLEQEKVVSEIEDLILLDSGQKGLNPCDKINKCSETSHYKYAANEKNKELNKLLEDFEISRSLNDKLKAYNEKLFLKNEVLEGQIEGLKRQIK